MSDEENKAKRAEEWGKWRSIKARMRGGEMVPREDFLFVKMMDQKMNARRSMARRHMGRRMSYGPRVIGNGFQP